MSSRAPRPHFFQPELPPCLDWRPRRRWPLGVTVQRTALRHLRRLLAERERVWEDEDPEAVHGIRVATRRLRSTLQTFATLWPEEDMARWNRELGRFARAFGEARDLDVHLESLAADDDDAQRSAAREWLATRWRERRADLTDDLRRTLVRFERSWTPQRLMEFLSTRPLDLWAWCAENEATETARQVRGRKRSGAASTSAAAHAAEHDDDAGDAIGPGGDDVPSDTDPAGRGPPDSGTDDDTPPDAAGSEALLERRPPRPPARRTPRA